MSFDTFVDAFSLVMEDEEENKTAGEIKTPDTMLIESLNNFARVDIEYIARGAGLSVPLAVAALKGAIYQRPEVFIDDECYDVTKGWTVSSDYFSGNIRKKLAVAQEMNKRFSGKFSENVAALSRLLPETLDINEIHISLGASWIPVEEYALFAGEFLNLGHPANITYSAETATYKVHQTVEDTHSILNTRSYGVCEDRVYASGYRKQYLTALEIIEQTLNAKTIKVFDYDPTCSYGNVRYEPVFNQEKTIEAQDKQRALIAAFREWVYSKDRRIIRFERYYNEAFVGYSATHYDGSFLSLPGLNPQITLYQKQRNSIARVLLSENNVLFAHEVGAGKTYEMICSVHELWRLNISKKNLFVVPNNVLQATVDAHRLLYKDDKILVIYPKDFSPQNRDEILAQIRDGEFVAVYMAYSTFDLIVMSKQYYVDKFSKKISELKAAAYNAGDKYMAKSLKSQAKRLEKKLSKFVLEEEECPYLTFEELGINTLVVDEAHNYKNIAIPTRSDNVVGMSGSGSKKCREMLEKAHSVDRLIFATGTPLTNSLSDLFTLQTYLQPQVLEYHKIHTFDAWVNTFGKRETTVECDVDANSRNLRTMTRFASFHNLSELMALFSQVCDFYQIEKDESGLPEYKGAQNICVAKSPEQSEYIKGLSERTEKIRAREVKRNEDNLLKVTTDGRKAALDIRLADGNVIPSAGFKTKIDACAEKLWELYNKYPDTTQVVFSDIGTPKLGFNVYDCLKKRLTELGVCENEIAFVHDATTETARTALFKNMNKGLVRVVIGSTQKLGVGVNVQEKLIALHHLSVPWRPADMVQREGRILRKGNTCPEIFIYRYITEGSFDAYSWQLLENKQKFISSFLSGTSAAREMDDIADSVLTYAEVKALAIGNPLIKERVEISNLLERKRIILRARQKQLCDFKTVIETTPEKITRLKKLAETAYADYEAYGSAKKSVPNDERVAFGEELLEALSENENRAEERVFDEYQGFSVVLPAAMLKDTPHVYLKSERGGSYYAAMELDKPPIGCSRSLDYLLEHLGERGDKLTADIAKFRKQIEEARKGLSEGNPYIAEADALRARLEAIDLQLAREIEKEQKAC